MFESVSDLVTVKIQDHDAEGGVQRVVLCHFPMLVWDRSHHGAWQLHGHCHGTLPPDPHARRMDVGVDAVAGYAPISYEEVKRVMLGKSWRAVDRHGTSD